MKEVTAEVERQLVEAQAELAQSMEAAGPPVEEMAATEALGTLFGGGGSGVAKHILLDHYFTSALRRLYVYSGGWRYRNVTNVEEQGLAQVAFASNRVDAWWDSNNTLTILRCWKHF